MCMAMITSSNVSSGLYVICQGNPQNIEQQSWMEPEERVGENKGFMPPMMAVSGTYSSFKAWDT